MKRGPFLGASIVLLLLQLVLLSQPVASQPPIEITICYINTTAKETPAGSTLTVIFGVFYPGYAPCGNPVELKPRSGQTGPTGSFDVEGSPATRFTDVPVKPTGVPGQYRAELAWPADAPAGKEVVFVVANSIYDGRITGPGRNTSYLQTPDPTDDSTFLSTPAPSVIPVTTIVAAVLVILLLLLLLLAVRRRRKKAQATKR